MIGLLDPALFLFRAEADIINDLDNVLRASRAHKIELTPLREYWPDLWSQLGKTLEGRLSPEAKRTLQAVRRAAPQTDTGIGALPANAGIVWRRGFTEMFGDPHLHPEWTDRMAFAVIRAVSSGQPVVVFCRRMVGRNLVIHSAGNSTCMRTCVGYSMCSQTVSARARCSASTTLATLANAGPRASTGACPLRPTEPDIHSASPPIGGRVRQLRSAPSHRSTLGSTSTATGGLAQTSMAVPDTTGTYSFSALRRNRRLVWTR